jgi:hypothetical protein
MTTLLFQILIDSFRALTHRAMTKADGRNNWTGIVVS